MAPLALFYYSPTFDYTVIFIEWLGWTFENYQIIKTCHLLGKLSISCAKHILFLLWPKSNRKCAKIIMAAKTKDYSPRHATDLNTWIADSHGFAYSSMRATGNTSAAILLQSKHLIDTMTSTHISAWNATGDRFLASNFMKILRKKNNNNEKVPQTFESC